ncbi:FG-GAP-like repeat-containing protein, partial [Myxococcota bacterium]|nr:FG-GAP-like repeat-containing protein [Myxococcota bacterium]
MQYPKKLTRSAERRDRARRAGAMSLAWMMILSACGGPVAPSSGRAPETETSARAEGVELPPPPPSPIGRVPPVVRPGRGESTRLGYLEGRSDVSPAGTFSYTVPLDVPPGRGGLAPSLALVLTRGGHGPFGLGGSLSGLSVINRCPRTIDDDGDTDRADGNGTDRFCLDGEKLVRVGPYPPNPALFEYRPVSDPSVRVVPAGDFEWGSGPSSVTVYLANGRVRTYELFGRPYVTGTETGYSPSSIAIDEWLLTKEEDRNGNAARYRYTSHVHPENHAVGHVIDEITYTWAGNDERSANRRVKFNYQTSPYPTLRFRAGRGDWVPVLVASIEMFGPTLAGDLPTTQWRYDLEYDGNGRMTSVQQCGQFGRCTWKKIFTYSQPASPFIAARPAYQTAATYPLPNALGSLGIFDANGDGYDDMLYWRDLAVGSPLDGTFLRLTTTDASGDVLPLADERDAWTSPTTLDDTMPIDPDGDGKYGLMAGDSNGCRRGFYFWHATNGFSRSFAHPDYEDEQAPGSCIDDGVQLPRQAWVDLNGDGRLDRVGQTSSHGAWTVRMNLGNGHLAAAVTPMMYTPSGGTSSVPVYSSCSAKPADLDGDGRGELLVASESDCSEHQSIRMLDDGTIRAVRVTLPFGGVFQFVDLNGDGLEDAARVEDGPAGKVLKVSWNLGTDYGEGFPRSFGPEVALTDPDVDTAFSRGGGFTAVDVNEDGYEDLLILDTADDPIYGRGVYALLSRGDGELDFVETDLQLRTQVAMGDFNGDGLKDLVTWGRRTPQTDNSLEVMLHAPNFVHLIESISDEDGAQPRERVEYTRVANHDAATFCGYPQRCVRRGMVVVAAHERSNGGELGSYRRTEYAYEDPRSSALGSGFLAFAKVRSFDVDTGRETLTTFDLTTKFGDKWLFAQLPATTREIAPIFDPAADATPAFADARITDTTHTYYRAVLSSGLSFHTRLVESEKVVWEQASRGGSQVAIDWTSGRWPHVTGIIPVTAAEAARHETRNLEYDAFGNVEVETQQITGGETRVTEKTYAWRSDPARVDAWLVGLPSSMRELSITADGTWAERFERYGFDAAGNLVRVETEPNGTPDEQQTIEHTIGAFGNVVQTRNTAVVNGAPETRTVHFAYDADSTFETTRWSGPLVVWQSVHPSFGATLVSRDANGVEHWTSIDDLGRVVATSRNLQPMFSIRRAPRIVGDVVGIIERVENEVTREYSETHTDELGRVVLQASNGFSHQPPALGQLPNAATLAFTRTTYDHLGNVAMISRPGFGAPSSDVFTYQADTLGRKIRAFAPDGSMTEYFQHYYSVAVETPTGSVGWATLNRDGQVTASTVLDDQGNPVTVQFSYGPFNRLRDVVGADGATTHVEYDRRGRRTLLVEPNSGTTRLAWDGFGQIRAVTEGLQAAANGLERRTYAYDGYGQLETITDDGPAFAQPETTSFVWGASAPNVGQLLSATSPDGVVTSFVWDALGRTTQRSWTIGSETFSFDFGFDAADRLTSIRYPDVGGGLPRYEIRRDFNAAGFFANVEEIAAPAVSALDPALPQSVWRATGREARGLLTAEEFGNGALGQRTYYPTAGHLQLSTVTTALGLVARHRYAYDASGRITSREELGGRVETFDHDRLDRLARWTISDGGSNSRTTRYGYDAAGNLLTVEVDGVLTHDNVYGGTPLAGPHALTLDRVTGRAYGYDALGRMIDAPRREIRYTPNNLPRQVIDDALGRIDFSYDAFGSRVLKESESASIVSVAGLYQRRSRVNEPTEHVFTVVGAEG